MKQIKRWRLLAREGEYSNLVAPRYCAKCGGRVYIQTIFDRDTVQYDARTGRPIHHPNTRAHLACERYIRWWPLSYFFMHDHFHGYWTDWEDSGRTEYAVVPALPNETVNVVERLR